MTASDSSYSSGSVGGISKVGGLAGWNDGSVTASYANGPISGYGNVGGLVGANIGSIYSSYSLGSVSGSRVGGLLGG
jgi:hypothetical protein